MNQIFGKMHTYTYSNLPLFFFFSSQKKKSLFFCHVVVKVKFTCIFHNFPHIPLKFLFYITNNCPPSSWPFSSSSSSSIISKIIIISNQHFHHPRSRFVLSIFRLFCIDWLLFESIHFHLPWLLYWSDLYHIDMLPKTILIMKEKFTEIYNFGERLND